MRVGDGDGVTMLLLGVENLSHFFGPRLFCRLIPPDRVLELWAFYSRPPAVHFERGKCHQRYKYFQFSVTLRNCRLSGTLFCSCDVPRASCRLISLSQNEHQPIKHVAFP
jgi:hypothetical protein